MNEKIGQIPEEVMEGGGFSSDQTDNKNNLIDRETEDLTTEISVEDVTEQINEHPTGELNVADAVSDLTKELGIDAEGKDVGEIAEEVQEKLGDSDNKGLLTKLGTGKLGRAVKVLMFAVGMSVFGGGLAEKVSADDVQNNEKIENKVEEKYDYSQSVMTMNFRARIARKWNFEENQVNDYINQSIDLMRMARDNGTSTDELLEQVDGLFFEKFLTFEGKRKELADTLKEQAEKKVNKVKDALSVYFDMPDHLVSQYHNDVMKVAYQTLNSFRGGEEQKQGALDLFNANCERIMGSELQKYLDTSREQTHDILWMSFKRIGQEWQKKADKVGASVIQAADFGDAAYNLKTKMLSGEFTYDEIESKKSEYESELEKLFEAHFGNK